MEVYRAIKNNSFYDYLIKNKVKFLADEGEYTVINALCCLNGEMQKNFFKASLEQCYGSELYSFKVYENTKKKYASIRKFTDSDGWKIISFPAMTYNTAFLMTYDTALFNSTPGGKKEFNQSGSFDLKLLKNRKGGVVNLYRDGKLIKTEDLYSPYSITTYKISFSAPSGEKHRYAIEIADKKNPQSLGTEVLLDAILINSALDAVQEEANAT